MVRKSLMNKGTKRNLGLRLPLRLIPDATKEQMNPYRVLKEMTVKKSVYKEVSVMLDWPLHSKAKRIQGTHWKQANESWKNKHIGSCLTLRRQNLKLTPAQSEGLGYCLGLSIDSPDQRPYPRTKENSETVIGDPEGVEGEKKTPEKVVGNKTSLCFSVFL